MSERWRRVRGVTCALFFKSTRCVLVLAQVFAAGRPRWGAAPTVKGIHPSPQRGPSGGPSLDSGSPGLSTFATGQAFRGGPEGENER